MPHMHTISKQLKKRNKGHEKVSCNFIVLNVLKDGLSNSASYL